MAAAKCATQKKFRHSSRTKNIEQQTGELTTFHQQASSGKRNERYYEEAHEFMKKNGESEI